MLAMPIAGAIAWTGIGIAGYTVGWRAERAHVAALLRAHSALDRVLSWHCAHVLVVAAWYVVPHARFVAIPAAIVAVYLVTILVLVRRGAEQPGAGMRRVAT